MGVATSSSTRRVRQSGADPKRSQAAAVKRRGGERCANAGTMIPAGKVERGERKQTADEERHRAMNRLYPGFDLCHTQPHLSHCEKPLAAKRRRSLANASRMSAGGRSGTVLSVSWP
jgi:hypothetical protein